MQWTYDDGGRADAGFRGETGDCVTRAAAIVTGLPYREVYALVNEHGADERRRDGRRSQARTGVYKPTTRKVMETLGLVWTPTMQIGSGCQVHMRAEELPAGRIIVKLSRHTSAVIEGVVRDTYDPSRDGTRCVYGYWRPTDA